MINIIFFLLNLIIQFGSYTIPVTVEPTIIDETIIDLGFQDMLNKGGVFSYYGDVKISNGGVIIFAVDSGSYIEVHYALANHNYNTSVVSTFNVRTYQLADNGIYGDVDYSGFTGYVFYYYPNSPSSSFGGSGGFSNTFSYPISLYGNGNILQFISSEITDTNGNTILIPPDAVEVPSFPVIGSLNSSGHSSGGDPLEELQSFSWDKNTYVFNSTGHSIGVSSSAAAYNFSNPEQNLLGQIVDNTNGLISNTNNLGGALETINNNVINSAVALYNGISQFNNNFISSYVYDEEKVDEVLTNSSMFAFANATTEMTETIINESDVLLDAVHDMEEKQDLVIYLDLTNWRVPVYSSSTGVNTSYIKPYNEVVQIDFSFLKETKSIWQPILLGILYLSLFLSIYFDLPNILRGANA